LLPLLLLLLLLLAERGPEDAKRWQAELRDVGDLSNVLIAAAAAAASCRMMMLSAGRQR
jgi:hypothetical protein